MKKLFLILILHFAFYTLHSEKVAAATFSATVYPKTIELKAENPGRMQSQIIIENKSEETLNLDISLLVFGQSADENGQVKYLNSPEQDFKDPLTFQRIKIFDGANEITSLSLAPKQKRNLILSVDIPPNEPPADYYFSIIFVSSKNPKYQDLQTNKSEILAGIATNVLLSIGPPEKPKAQISQFQLPFFQEKGPVEFSVKITNQGNHFISPKGQIVIKNMFGQTVGSVDLPKTNVLTDSSRFMPAVWPEKFLLGPYTANLTVLASDNGLILRKTTYFIGAPVQFFGSILIVTAALAVIRKRLKKRLSR